MNFKEKLGKELLFFDGAMGTMLQSRGMDTGVLPETWNVLHPEVIGDIHGEYLSAGCNIIKANTFGANRYKLSGTGYSVAELVSAGVDLARQAVSRSGADALVALDIGSLGKLMKPFGQLGFDEAYDAFCEIISAGNGADLILIETVSDTYEAKAAVLAAKESSSLPVAVTMTFSQDGKLLTGGDIGAAVALLEGLSVDAIGINCGLGPGQIEQLMPELRQCSSLPIIVSPNAGLPVVQDGRTIYSIEPDEFAFSIRQLALGGAHLVGGCCGTTPAHIARVVELCSDVTPLPVTRKNLTVVSSYSHSVTFGETPLIIGERINPTGKPRLRQALLDNDCEYLVREGISEEDSGAHILDVNVGVPGVDEVAMIEQAVTGLQAVVTLPLQIDTSDIAAMESALRIYNGKAMINSVNGKQETMDAVFPLAKKYGGVVVCLTLDEDGIPETAEGRVSIAKRIVERAEQFGISPNNLVIDTLAMTVSTGGDNGKITLDALGTVRHKLGLHTVLGVSNISFGLPQRERINSAFLTMAMNSGLSACIINPLSDPMMSAYFSFCALAGLDTGCLNYIGRFSQTGQEPAPVAPESGDMSLFDCIVKGLCTGAQRATEKLLVARDSMSIINEELIPALDTVGKGFEQGRYFLPQLLMSADAAKAAFDTIKAALQKGGNAKETRAKVVIASVKGDIHDIGKNIVKVLLQNYGFEVIDLGKDVPPETIAEAVIKWNVKLLGLSALMTTTVANMEKTISLVREIKGDCLIMVGGAVLTPEYADDIGADFYSKDAMGAVRYANRLCDEGVI